MTTDDDQSESVPRRRQKAGGGPPPDTPEGRFGDVVRQLRRAAGLSQEELALQMTARGIDLSQIQISRLEAGGRPIRLNEAIALAECLHVDPSDLVGSVAEPHGTTGSQAAERAAWVRLRAADAVWSRALAQLAVAIDSVRGLGAEAETAFVRWIDARAALGDSAPDRSPDLLLLLDADGRAMDPLNAMEPVAPRTEQP